MTIATDMRASAKNLRLLASVFENNAVCSKSAQAVAGWDKANLCLLDAASALDATADVLEDVWPKPRRRSNDPRPAEHR